MNEIMTSSIVLTLSACFSDVLLTGIVCR